MCFSLILTTYLQFCFILNLLMEDLDKFDLQILDILQKDNQTSQRDIGDIIGLSAAAVQRRIKRMRENKIITSDISVIDPKK